MDALIASAGLNRDAPLLEMSEADWDRVLAINLKGSFLCAQIAARHMLAGQREGSMVLLGAATAITGRKNGANYCASKAGVLSLTKCLALELAPSIRVNCILPGYMETEEVVERYQLRDPEKLTALQQTIPLQRLGTPEEIAEAVSFLLSSAARYITGQKLLINGGEYMY